MLNYEDKIEVLNTYLLDIKDSYANSFKTDIFFYFNEFEDIHSVDFKFIHELNSKEEIYNWIDSLTSKIVMKFNENEGQLSEFIFYTLNP